MRSAWARSSSTQPDAADDGPPTRSRASTDFTAAAVTSYRRRYSSGVPVQNTSRLASFQTSNDQLSTQLLEAVAVGQVRDEVADQVVPAVPVPGRGDDRVVREHGRARVAGQVVRHERELDDRVEADPAQVVVDPVDAGEVVHRLAVGSVRLAVDRQVVAEDRVRPDVADAELAMSGGQRGGAAPRRSPARRWSPRTAGARGARCRSSAATAGAARPRSSSTSTRISTGPVASSLGVASTGAGPLPLDVDVGERGHGVPPRRARLAGRVGVRRVRDGEHVAAGVVERLPGPAASGAA